MILNVSIIMKEAFFAAVTYNDVPLIWKIDQNKNQASCTFTCIGDPKTIIPKEKVLHALKEQAFPNITLYPNKAIIHDYRAFTAANLPREPLSLDQLPNSNPGFFLRRRSSGLSSREGQLIQSQHSADKEKEKETRLHRSKSARSKDSLVFRKKSDDESNYSQIDIDSLTKDSALKASTFVHEEYFEPRTKRDAHQRKQLCLQTVDSLISTIINVGNQDLHPLKAELTQPLRDLMDNYLNPAYKKWCQECQILPDKRIFCYFKTALEDVMCDDTFNKAPTEFENLSGIERQAKFKGNQMMFDFANEKIRKQRANLMLLKFRTLIKPDLSLNLTESSKKSLILLTSFKDYLGKQAPLVAAVNERLLTIQKKLVEIGLTKLKSARALNLIQKQIKNEEPKIMGFHAFSHLLATWLESKLLLKNKNSNSKCAENSVAIAKSVTIITIQTITGDKPATAPNLLMPRLQSCHEEFYLCDSWANNIRWILEKIDIKALCKHPDRNKEIEHFTKEVGSHVHEYIEHKIRGFHAFSPLLAAWLESQFLKTQHGNSKCTEQSMAIAKKVTLSIIKKINGDKPAITPTLPMPKLQFSQEELYLCDGWASSIHLSFEEIDITSLCKHPDKSKEIDYFAKEVADLFITGKLNAPGKNNPLFFEIEKEEEEPLSPRTVFWG